MRNFAFQIIRASFDLRVLPEILKIRFSMNNLCGCNIIPSLLLGDPRSQRIT